MQIKINRKEFSKAISKAKIACQMQSHLPILSSALLIAKGKTLEVFATDLEVFFHGIYPAQIISPGTVTVPINTISNFIRESKSREISLIKKESNQINISDGAASFDFAYLPVDDFPIIPEAKEEQFPINFFDFKEMIDIVPAIQLEKYLGVICFQVIKKEDQTFFRSVLTNGHCLVLMNKKMEIGINIVEGLISRESLEKLNKILLKDNNQKDYGVGLLEKVENNILLSVNQTHFIARKQKESVLMRLSEETFPNYEEIIKGNGDHVTVNRKDLLKCMRKMATIQESVSVNIESESMKIISVNPDIGEMTQEIKIEYSKAPIQLSFNPKYFVGLLHIMKSDKINLDIKGKELPCVITGKQDKGFLGVIAPLRQQYNE